MKPVNPICVLSESKRFVFVSIEKNGSSTLRGEFSSAAYGGVLMPLSEIEVDKLAEYFCFTILRDPMTRILSGYQEISMRQEENPERYPGFEFWSLPDSLERFESFLTEVERDKFDAHINDQAASIERVPIDFIGRLETLEKDLAAIADRIGFTRDSALPVRRSRKERAAVYSYDRYYLHPEELTSDIRSRIRRLYEQDYELYASRH